MSKTNIQHDESHIVKVLLIEDDPIYTELVHDIVATIGGPSFSVKSVDSLSPGLKHLANGGTDVVVLDLTLPDSIGLDTFHRTNAQAPEVPILILTGHDDERLAIQAVQAGAQDYLVKGQNEVSLLVRAIRYAIERKRIQRALRASEARFRKVIEKNADAIIIADRESNMRFANPAVETLLGRKPEKICGTIFEFPLTGGETTEIDIGDEQGKAAVAEMRVVEIEWDGEPAYLASLRDITDHKRMLVELEQTRQQQLQMKDVFLSKVSHELRTPLTAIHQFTTIVLDRLAGDITPEQREHLETVLRNVEQLRKMIDDLLEVTDTEINQIFEATRAEPGSVSVVLERMSLTELIIETFSTLRTIAANKGIALSSDVPGNLPPAHADPQRVRQVLNNLINNSIKFTPNNGTVNVSARLSDEDPGFLCVAVSDTGCGVDPEEYEKIFEYLYQVDNTIEHSRKGLGIGLYICKEIISRHGGRIWVESQSRQGSTFFFTLPVFSLTRFLAPIITPENVRSGSIGFITVEVFRSENQVLTRADEKMLLEIWNVLGHCILTDMDLVLPRMGRLKFGEIFFLVACCTKDGVEALIKRIQGQLARCENIVNADFSSVVSYTMVDVHACSSKPSEELILNIAANLEGLVEKAVCKRRNLYEQEKDSRCGR